MSIPITTFRESGLLDALMALAPAAPAAVPGPRTGNRPATATGPAAGGPAASEEAEVDVDDLDVDDLVRMALGADD